MSNNPELLAVLQGTISVLQNTVRDIGDQLQEGRAKLRQSASRARTVLSMTRLFVAFTEKNRSQFISFLHREHAITVEESEFKEKLSMLVEMLPSDQIEDLSKAMEQLLLVTL